MCWKFQHSPTTQQYTRTSSIYNQFKYTGILGEYTLLFTWNSTLGYCTSLFVAVVGGVFLVNVIVLLFADEEGGAYAREFIILCVVFLLSLSTYFSSIVSFLISLSSEIIASLSMLFNNNSEEWPVTVIY